MVEYNELMSGFKIKYRIKGFFLHSDIQFVRYCIKIIRKALSFKKLALIKN